MKERNRVRQIIIIVIIFVLILLGSIFIFPLGNKKEEDKEDQEKFDTSKLVTTKIVDKNIPRYRIKWEQNKKINDDYIGEIIFDSGLLEISFVQAKSIYDRNGKLYHCYNRDGSLVTDTADKTGNDVYIYTDWKTMKYDLIENGGSVFMDYRNELSDQNLIIYGHQFPSGSNLDPERKKAFTPLEKLLSYENYEENKNVKLILENEVREYELVSAYYFDSTDDSYWEKCQYWRVNFNYDDYADIYDEEYFSNYIDFIKTVQLYDTGVEIDPTADKLLTFQTCVSDRTGELYEILVFKQISSLFE